MSSRKLEDIDFEIREKFIAFERELTTEGIDFVRACTYRSSEEQAALYAQGRTAPGRIVTHCKAGESLHNATKGGLPASRAADYYPLINGKLAGNKTSDELAYWHKMGQIGGTCELEWGGNWSPQKVDMPHFQLPEGDKK